MRHSAGGSPGRFGRQAAPPGGVGDEAQQHGAGGGHKAPVPGNALCQAAAHQCSGHGSDLAAEINGLEGIGEVCVRPRIEIA